MALSTSHSSGPGNDFQNGPALAALLAAGIGALALGLVVLLNEMGVLTVPALYAPAGGVSGRTTLGVVAWLIAWGVLHARWKARDVDAARVGVLTLLLVLASVVATYPPVWTLF